MEHIDAEGNISVGCSGCGGSGCDICTFSPEEYARLIRACDDLNMGTYFAVVGPNMVQEYRKGVPYGKPRPMFED